MPGTLYKAAAIIGAAESDQIGFLDTPVTSLQLHIEAIRNVCAETGIPIARIDGVFSAGWSTELCEHLGTADNRHQPLSRRCHFRIGFIDRAGNNYGISITYVVSSVADEYGRALIFKAPGLFVRFQVRALHGIAKTQHDFGDT